MFKISEFSRLSKVSLKTLRYYDQIGILKPSKVDNNTGYRYYSAEQLLELNRILIYKELGFTLPQISQLLHEDISIEHIQGMFRLKKSEIETIIETEQTKLARIEERMLLIEKEGQVETGQEIRIKAEEEKLFLYLKARGNTDHIPTFFDEFQHLLSNTYQHLAQGPQVVLWQEVDEKEDEFEFEVGYFVTDSLTSIPPSLQLKTLPAEPMMATMAFHSNANFAGTACVDLAKWIQRNNYQIKEHEPGREFYLPLTSTQDAQLMEIQIPIKI